MPKITPHLSFIFLISILAYFPSLFYGFAQDDFIHLSASMNTSFWQVLNFFNPWAHFPDIFFYRPLTTQFWFFINTQLFGLNPLPFHVEALIFHGLNSCLFYLIVKKLWNQPKIALTSSILYGLSAAHFLSLYYISSFQEIGRIFFLFSSILFFLKFMDTKRWHFYIYSLISFVLALFSKETSLILPLLLIPILLLHRSHESIRGMLKKITRPLAGFLIVSGLFLIVRVIGFQSIFGQGDYHLTSSVSDIFQNLKWYLIWSFGLPEVLASYPSLKLASLASFSHDLPYGRIVLGLAEILGIVLALALVLAAALHKKLNSRLASHLTSTQARAEQAKFLILNAILYLIALLPVLPLAGHRYPQYLDLAFLAFLPLLAWLLTKSKIGPWLGYSLLGVFIILQMFSLELSRQSHWATHRSQVADFYHQQLMSKVGSGGNMVVFVGQSNQLQQVSYALAKDYAMKVWFNCLIGQVKYLPLGQPLPSGQSILIVPVTKY